jgi:hypothetical protein
MIDFPLTKKQKTRLEEFAARVVLGLAMLAVVAAGILYDHEMRRLSDDAQEIASEELSNHIEQTNEELQRRAGESLERETAEPRESADETPASDPAVTIAPRAKANPAP